MAFISQDQAIKKEDPIKEELKKMHLVLKDTFVTVGLTEFNTILESDTTLLSYNVLYRQAVNFFYISATEVTNKEWKEFYLAMKEELGVEQAMKLYYPDTLTWQVEFKYSYNEPMSRNYFQHPIFKDYPVVGISWLQAQAYCKWRTQKLVNLAKKKGKIIDMTFRLPTTAEWELAARGPKGGYGPKRSDLPNYPWNHRYIENGKHLANFGRIEDKNGAEIKNHSEDGGLYTTPVGKYPPNLWGLYDMAGNVAEWVADTAMIYSSVSKKLIFKTSDIDLEIEYFNSKTDSLGWDKELITYFRNKLIHDEKILSSGDMRTIKGGSWSNGLAYLQIGSKEAREKENVSCGLGFRVAMSYDPKFEKYFPTKNWKAPKYKNPFQQRPKSSKKPKFFQKKQFQPNYAF